MAILLIKFDSHWMDSLSQEEIDRYAANDLGFIDAYNARYQKYDVIEVREDGCPIGELECLPKFFVLKVDGKKADWLHLMEPQTTNELKFDTEKLESYVDKKTVMRRKYQFPLDDYLTKEKLDKIKTSEAMVIDTYDPNIVVDKAVK